MRFDPDAAYTENQLNEIIKRHHWDTATLRREMVGYRTLARNEGIYRRLSASQWRSEENGTAAASTIAASIDDARLSSPVAAAKANLAGGGGAHRGMIRRKLA